MKAADDILGADWEFVMETADDYFYAIGGPQIVQGDDFAVQIVLPGFMLGEYDIPRL